MKHFLLPLALLFISYRSINAQVYTQSTVDGSITISPQGMQGSNNGNAVSSNTVLGANAMKSNTTGYNNTAMGLNALFSNRGGHENTGVGMNVLYSSYGNYNTAMGHETLMNNGPGSVNTAIGQHSMQYNWSGSVNTAVGVSSLQSNTSGNGNTGIGMSALYNNRTGINNTALGISSLYATRDGRSNTGVGASALADNNLGSRNTAVGDSAGWNNVSGNSNTFLGYMADASATNLTNAIAIGYNAEVNADDKAVIGNAAVATIGGYGAWTNYSDRRLKENIIYTNRLGLDFILKLKTASYNYSSDPYKRRRDGLIAQDVQQTLREMNIPFSGLVEDKDEAKTLNLSYAELVVPLVNAVQELDRNNRHLQAENEELRKKLARIDELEELKGEIAKLKAVLNTDSSLHLSEKK
ncbi:tail fiber domain-containing protein [Runella sp.]|uniref:tail fiber domain-containing protein n=1 Tax=Runella sp. TaxID=1960881 RepID=UPI003D11B8C7